MRKVVVNPETNEIELVEMDMESEEMKEWKAKQRKKIAEIYGLEWETE